ncbi:MAG: SoxR reducing system RseC family protein [Oscillospiraceae bacterium]|jgi:sigma-E factor negative regulatory protein RseC|nr:SoxR reducing system RseC family protein [Oscillospiraceae bacterium]
MTQTAKVVKLKGPGLCEVRVRRVPACGGECAACGGCEMPDIDILAFRTEKVREGDTVLIENAKTLRLAALVFLLPLLLFFTGTVFHPVAGGAGLLVGIGVVLGVNRFLQKRGGVTAKVVAVLERR